MAGRWMAVLLACSVACGAQARIWTNAEGKTLEAELERVKGDKVFLKITKNRQIHPFDIASFSAADQAYIKEYMKAQEEELKKQELKKRKAKWHNEFADAKAEAEKYDLPILLLYTAPEWCGYCVNLETRLLKTTEFKRFSNENLVLLEADFSDPNDKKKWMKENAEVSSKFKVGGYPSMFFITADMRRLGRLGGYNDDLSTEAYLQQMAEIIQK